MHLSTCNGIRFKGNRNIRERRRDHALSKLINKQELTNVIREETIRRLNKIMNTLK
jgi:hypothetical protein